MRALLLLVLCLIPKVLEAAPPLSLDQTYDELFKHMMDDPSAINKWAKDQLDQGIEARAPFPWAKAIALYVSSCMELGCPDSAYTSKETVGKALAIADSSSDQALFIRMKLILGDIGKDAGAQETDFHKTLEPIRLLAEERGGGRLLADVYRAYAAAAETESNLQQALIYAQQALEMAEKFGYPGDMLPILIKNDSAILAGRMGDQDKSITLYQQVIDYCTREKIRHMGAIAMINLGRIFARLDAPESIKKGLSYLDRADAIVRDLGEERLFAFSHLIRGEALLNLKEYSQALPHVEEALKKFKKLDSTIWTADTLHWKARVLAGMKRWNEALDMIAQSDALFPEHFTSDKAQLTRERAAALHGLGRDAEAYRQAEAFIAMHEKIDEKSKKDDLNQLQVQLGYKIQEQENQLLKKENQIKEHQLREAELIKKVAGVLGVLTIAILVLLFIATNQFRKTKQAKARIQYILDHIEEGIITVGRDLKVESSLSPYLDHVIGHDAPESAKQNVMLYLLDKSDLNPDARQAIRDIITSCVDEVSLAWELNAGNLPQELSLDHGARILSLHWQPLYGKDQRIKRILVAMRDVTLRHRLEQEVGEARAQRGRLQHIMEEVALLSPQRFQLFIHQTRSKAQKIQDGENLRSILPDLHSLKGEARTLGLRDLASATHQLEGMLDERQHPNLDPASILACSKDWCEVWKDYESFAMLINARQTQMPLVEFNSLVQIIADQWPAVQKHCQEQGIPLHRITVEEQIFPWNADLRQGIKDILLHALINSIDHGFKQQDSQQAPEIGIRLQRNARGFMELTIRDNGRGLNWDKLDKLIQDRGFVPGPGQSLADVVFLEGISTADKISQTSGRGVGLSAIQRIASSLRGVVHIRDRENGKGCELQIELAESAS